LLHGALGFAGEESAGASFLRRDGAVWTTDKDGMIAALLAAEITAITKKDPGDTYRELTEELGDPSYDRAEAPANSQQKTALAKIDKESIQVSDLAGEKILAILTVRRGTAMLSAASRWLPKVGGSRRGPHARRTSTKSMPKVFAGKSIYNKLKRRPRQSLARHWRRWPLFPSDPQVGRIH